MVSPSKRPATILLDNEAVQALTDIGHANHAAALAVVQVINDRRRRQRSDPPRIIVPVAVRIEAGWDRTRRRSSEINRITRAADWPLTAERADEATRIRLDTGVTVVDATIGQAAREADGPVVIVTSDVTDMTDLAGNLTNDIRVTRI